jgi:alpha-beta hydrolase superfamily lysophospholipase
MRIGSALSALFVTLGLGVGYMTNARAEELTLITHDGIPLSGTLTVPKNMKALFIPLHGSFVQTRDGDLDESQKWMFPLGTPKRRLFASLNEILSPLGVGSFRYDKRASGKSGGTYETTDLMDLALDANAVFAEMRRRFPKIPIGFIGQSEGSLVALKSYDLGIRPDFMILQGPLLDRIDKFLEFQKTHAAAPFLNDKDGSLSKRLPYLSAFYQAAYKDNFLKKLHTSNDDLYELKLPGWNHLTSLKKYRQYDWSGYELLKKVTCPTLMLVGSEDGNVSPDTVRQVALEQKTKGVFKSIKVEILPGLEHSFREVTPGDTFVSIMEKPLSPRYISAVESFFGQPENLLCKSALGGETH